MTDDARLTVLLEASIELGVRRAAMRQAIDSLRGAYLEDQGAAYDHALEVLEAAEIRVAEIKGKS